MIYTTGTIAISGNTLTGTGTNFTAAGSLIRNGCTVIALTSPAQVFQITAIGSATSLTVTPAANPAIPAGTKYAILLSDSLSVDGLAQDIAETFTMYQRYMSGFADVMNGTTDVTITINGVAVTVPGQKSLAKKGANSDITSLSGLTTALSISQGGTGAKNAADARTNLGLGSSATRNIIDSPTSLTADAVLVPGYRGIGLPTLAGGGGDTVSIYQNFNGSGFYTIDGSRVTSQNIPNWWHPSASGNVWGGGVYISRTSVQVIEFLASRDGKAGIRVRRDSTVDPVQAEFYTTLNTTKASDGTLKAASPVARIVNSQADNQRKDVDEEGFTWCGCGTANAEAEGITLSRLDVGVYMLTGSAGLASSGWQLLPPMDPGGMGELGVVEAEQTENGVLTIRLFKRKYMLNDEGEIVKTKGAPMDVPSNSWIDVRLDMPENSVWNQRQKAAVDAAENESGS
ncbi:phage tail fiber protein [Enterobacter mori]|uniref:phage tail fiber protein n=1 Tax=Enterobacter mori TaxID=539813 RepID=UPI001C682A98|nr:phage tail protein [Enterobacter mori]MBW8246383.1 phage tail protein [Enterobacter mori]MBW8250698.1 phage tail protein [Enterobacter mori]